MSELKLDVSVYGSLDESSLLSEDIAARARTAEEMGVDGVWSSETDNNGLLALPLAAEHTDEVEIGSRIVTSFTRSPMVLAYSAWDLAQYSDGRFTLGLGTQVKGHNERRFSVEWSSPGPRLREVVESLQHIWRVFQGEEDQIDYQGEHYSFSLMTKFFDPGPIDHPDIPIHVAGLNEYNVRLAGELCDGLAIHSFNTPSYAEEVITPRIEEGAKRGNRSPDEVEIAARPFTITGETEEEMERRRREARRRIAFYGSTRTYHEVLNHHGWKDVGERLHELSKDNDWDQMTDLVTDEMVEAFAVEAPVEDLADEVTRKYGEVADRVMLSIPFDGQDFWRDVVDRL
jgi:probable F420-dependent oxidoreductase